MRLLAIILFVLSVPALAAVAPHDIPRNNGDHFYTEGLFEGGTDRKANLESLRLAPHAGFERWVIDFSDLSKRARGEIAPRFQVRYIRGEKFQLGDGRVISRRPAKFIFVFRSIQKNFLKAGAVQRLAKKSRFVKDIILYPPIEKGDMAMEFVLKDNVLFAPFQPMEKEGRLVLDLKPALAER